MKSRTSGYSSDTEQNKQKDDLSVLRKPIHTALSGFLEAKKAYENGTDEIRKLLARECDVIYECHTCRNIFRSLTNFISHKRVYCRNSSSHFNGGGSFNPNNQNGFIDQDVSTIIQAEQEFVNKKINTPSTSSSKDNNINGNRDLSSIIERLLKREQNNRLMKLTDFYDQVNNKLTQDEILQQKHVLQLDRVPNSDVAVYQTVKKDESDNIKTEVDEVHEMHDKQTKTVLGSDGKVIPHSSTSLIKEIKKETLDEEESINSDKKQQFKDSNEIYCEICKLKFATEKTLKLHIQTKHISSTFVFQCPSCSLTFLQPGAVIRHLSNDHKKSTRKIRLMREAIYKRRIRMDEVQTKGPSRELARLQTDKERRDAENKAWLDNIERVDNSPMCTYCGKTFERKAVLNTHLNNCQMKNKLSNLVTDKTSASTASNRDSPVQLKSKLFNLFNEKTSTGSRVSPVPNNSTSTGTTSNKPPSKQLRVDGDSKLNSNSNSVDSFDLEQKYDINGDSKESIDLLEVKEELTGSGQNRRKRRKPPKILTRNDDVDSDTLNEMFANLGKNTDELSLKTVCFDNLTRAAENEQQNTEDSHIKKTENKPSETVAPVVKAEPKQRVNPNMKQLPCFCKICHKRFDALSNLRRHISMFHYRSRKFGCKLCDYRAFRKYDVVNHLGSAHSISGDKETTLEFVRVYEEKYFKDGVEEDIVLITDTENVPKENKPEEKRQRRPRGSAKIQVPSTSRKAVILQSPREPKITRSSSQLSLSSTDESIPNKRPIRNRVKPVNKDFVYDLSNLLKKDMLFAERESMRSLKRRNTNSVANDDSNQEAPTSTSPSATPSPPVINDSQIAFGFVLTKDHVHGAAQKIAQKMVSQGRAALATLPEIPTQRPLMRSRLLSVFRNCGSVPIIETSELEEAQYRASLSEDSFIDNFSKRRKIDLNLKPRLSLPDSPLNSLLMKVDMNFNGTNKTQTCDDNDKKHGDPLPCPTEKEFQEFPAKQSLEPVKKVHVLPFVDPVPSIPNFSSPPPTPTKRITLFQRLNENKAKRLQESLLRSALEN